MTTWTCQTVRRMQGWRSTALGALALLALLPLAADARKVGSKQAYVNGTKLIENFLAAINATTPGLPARHWVAAKSERQEQALLSGSVYDLLDSVRFTFGDPITGYSGLVVYYLYTRKLEQYTRSVIANDISFIQNGYLAYEEAPGKAFKYFLVWATWDEANAACTADGASLYSYDHPFELDEIMAVFYPTRWPWINLRYPAVEGGTVLLCGFLKADYDGDTVEFDDCSNRHNFICEKPVPDVPRKAGSIRGKQIVQDFWSSIRNPIPYAPKVRSPMLGRALPKVVLPDNGKLDKSLEPAIESLPASERYTVTGLGAASLHVYYKLISKFKRYAYNLASLDITYHQLDYLTFLEVPDKSFKYFLTKATFADAVDACVNDGAKLYSSEHSLGLDYLMVAIYPLLTPWMGYTKPGDEGGPDKCMYLRAEIYGSTALWDDCDDLHYFVCEKDSTPPEGDVPLPDDGGGAVGGSEIVVNIEIFIDSLRRLTDSINVQTPTSIRSELRSAPLALIEQIISLKDKKDTIEARWMKMSGTDQKALSAKLDKFAANMNKVASDETLMKQYFAETAGKRQLITVQLEEMILSLQPFF